MAQVEIWKHDGTNHFDDGTESGFIAICPDITECVRFAIARGYAPDDVDIIDNQTGDLLNVKWEITIYVEPVAA